MKGLLLVDILKTYILVFYVLSGVSTATNVRPRTIVAEMPQYSNDVYPGSLKKRYQTPLHFDEMIKSDSQRRAHLAEKAAQFIWRPHDASSVTYEPGSWIASRAYAGNNVTQLDLNSDMDEAAVNNDARLPYERPVPQRNLAYWTTELEHVTLEGTTLGGEDTPAKETPTNTAHLRSEIAQLDDPFVSPVRPHTVGQSLDQHLLCSPQANRPRARRSHHRGRSLLTQHTFLENGQIYHPQLHAKRPESVPNYSRPLTPDCQPTPRRATAPRAATVRARHSDQAIRYERVNGIYLDTTPRSAKERREGLSIPEIEARDLVKLDEWLHEHVPAEAVYTSLEPHPARPPPPIGGKENSVRAISPQPPSTGKNHTFVSRYSWNVESIPDNAADPAPVSTTTGQEPVEDATDVSDHTEPARELLTEIIRGILGPTGNSSQPDGEAFSGENNTGEQTYIHHDFPPDYSTLQPSDRPQAYEENFSPSRYIVDASIPEGGYLGQGSYRKRIGSLGRNVMKMITLRHSRMCGGCAI